MKIPHVLSLLVLVLFGASASPVRSQEPYIGEIRIFAGNFAPSGWEFCEGQSLLVAGNDPLFMVIGTTYGGNGTTHFNLPDLRGRFPVHPGGGLAAAPGDTGGGTVTGRPLRYLRSVKGRGVKAKSARATIPGSPTAPAVPPYVGVRYIISKLGVFPSP